MRLSPGSNVAAAMAGHEVMLFVGLRPCFSTAPLRSAGPPLATTQPGPFPPLSPTTLSHFGFVALRCVACVSLPPTLVPFVLPPVSSIRFCGQRHGAGGSCWGPAAAPGRGAAAGERRGGARLRLRVEPGRGADHGGRAGGGHRLHAALLRLLLAVAEAQRHPEVPARQPVAALELGPAAHGPRLHPRRHRQLLQGQQARRGRLRPRLQRRAERRVGDRGEAAVGAVAAGGGGVPERGGADRQAAAPQPGAAAGLVRRAGREAARLRVPPQPQPRRLPLRPEQERAAGVEHPAQRHRRHRPRPALPPRGLAAQGRAPGPQGQQRAPRPQDEPQDLRLRHGQDLRGRRRRHQHRPRRRNIRVHGAGVRLGGHLLGQVRRVQLRSPPPRDLERAAQWRPVPGGAPAIPHPRCMEAVDRGPGGRVHGPVAGALVLQGRGVAVLPRRPALRAGEPRRPGHHVQRPAHAHQRPRQAPGAGHAAALHAPQERPLVGGAARHQDRVDHVSPVDQRRVHHHDRAAMSSFFFDRFVRSSTGVLLFT